MNDPIIVGSSITTPSTEQPASVETAPVPGKPAKERSRGLWADAWHDLRRKPLFIIASVLILILLVMAAFPQLFASGDPETASLRLSLEPPSAHAWFGYDIQGYNVYDRTIYGARTSIMVGVLAVVGTSLIGGLVGILAGFYGGWLDTLFSRLGDVFFGLPFVLGAIVLLSTFAGSTDNPGQATIIALVIGALVVFGWPQFARIMRSSVVATKQADYVQAARALGAGSGRIIFRHLLPNCLAPILVVATIAIGAYIGAEATLSYLGVGLRAPVISWGVAISDNQRYLRTAPHALLFPAGFLSITVLSFVMLGDAVREALDPKLR